MLGTITKGAYDNTPIPDNVYLAKLVKVKEKAPPQSHPEWFPSLQWQFQILTEPVKGRSAFGKTPTNWIAGKKLDNWLVTLGINVARGTSLKIEDLKDLYVKILVKGKKYNDKQTGEEKIFSEVTELLPLDSIDQIKIRELVAGVSTTAAPVQNTPASTPAYIPTVPTFAQPHVQAGGYVPVTTSAPVPSVTIISNTPPIPSAPIVSPAPQVTGTPSRNIPF